MLEKEAVNIKLNNLYVDDEYITGTTSLGNIGLRIYHNYNGKIQIIEEGKSDSNGKFKMKLDPNDYSEDYMIEAYNPKTNEVLGYSNTIVNKSTDITKDGQVDIQDLADVAIYYGESIKMNGQSTLKEYIKYTSDINNDYYIDIFDLILISKRM